MSKHQMRKHGSLVIERLFDVPQNCHEVIIDKGEILLPQEFGGEDFMAVMLRAQSLGVDAFTWQAGDFGDMYHMDHFDEYVTVGWRLDDDAGPHEVYLVVTFRDGLGYDHDPMGSRVNVEKTPEGKYRFWFQPHPDRQECRMVTFGYHVAKDLVTKT